MEKQMSLTDVADNQLVSVVEVQGGHALRGRLQALGIRPGVRISKIAQSLGNGPLVVRTGQSQTALGRGICACIFVEAVK